ncbi:MAG TPA: glycosyltransferase family 4 protein [Solirubrobacteraceae bacterium]
MDETTSLPLRVLFITNAWPHPGDPSHGTHAAREVAALEAEGVRMTVLPIHGHASRWAYGQAAARVASLNGRGGFDVVHGYLGHAGAIARLYGRAPLVVTYTGSDLLGDRRGDGPPTRKSAVEAATFQQLARFSAATITQSEQMEGMLPAGARARNHVVPTGIPLDRFRPMPRDEARRRLGWPPDEQVVLWAANPARGVKNHPLAVATHRALRATHPDVRLRVAWSDVEDELPLDQLPLWMCASDVLLLTSRSEGSPNVVKEALATELPVVSTPVGDVAKLVRDVPGSHVRPPEPAALAAALADALAKGRSPKAREAVAGLDPADVARRVIGVYETVLAGRGRSGRLARS